MDCMHLVGSEEVGSAGRNISGAAERMNSAASSMDSMCESLLRRLEDVLQADRARRQELEALVATRAGMEADGRYPEDAFIALAKEMREL